MCAADRMGKPAETVDEMFWRVAYHVAKVEDQWDGDVIARARGFYSLLTSKKFFPNSPTFTGAGTPLGQLAACFVLPISDDMGRDPAGIFQTLRDAALIQQTGGGNGFSFSRLRPKGSLVKSSAGQATGPVGFLRVYDNAFGEVAQGGTRRGANMAVLRVDHPDIEEFITCKTDENAITNFNISVGITDAFMRAVENDEDWDLRFPDVHSAQYRETSAARWSRPKQPASPWSASQDSARPRPVREDRPPGPPQRRAGHALPGRRQPLQPGAASLPARSHQPVRRTVAGALRELLPGFGQPGPALWPATAQVDWESLRQSVELATIFLDDVVDANAYVPAVPQLAEAAHRARRIGLGIMGLADLMYHAGIRYGSTEGQEFAAQVMEFVRYHAMRHQHRAWPKSAAPSRPSTAAFTTRQPVPGRRRSRWNPTATTTAARPWIGTGLVGPAARIPASATPPRPPSPPPAPSPPWPAARATAASRSSPWPTSATSTTTARTCS